MSPSPAAPRSAPRFELGINYWPRRSAMAMWRELDRGEVAEDFARIREIGAQVVRIFCLTRDFLPGPLEVDGDKVAALVQVAALARDAGLRSVPTLIVINMSGAMWWPGWMLEPGGGARDLYGDPLVLRSQALLAATCARALAGDDSVRAFDLANEIDDAQRPARHAAWLWAQLLAGCVRRSAPGVPVRVGAHLPSLTSREHMRLDDLAEVLDEDCMHAYPLYSDLARGPLDPELVPFSCALTAELAGRGRAPLMQEFGLCTAPPGSPGLTIEDDFLGRPSAQYLASEEEAADYYREVLERLVATGAAGAYAWCYGDYAPALFDRPPLDRAVRERSFGLVRADGSEKPAAGVIRELARRLERGELVPGSAPPLLDVSADRYHEDPAGHACRLYQRWLFLRGAGE
jgi:endo-1,4-beta-mannosidase